MDEFREKVERAKARTTARHRLSNHCSWYRVQTGRANDHERTMFADLSRACADLLAAVDAGTVEVAPSTDDESPRSISDSIPAVTEHELFGLSLDVRDETHSHLVDGLGPPTASTVELVAALSGESSAVITRTGRERAADAHVGTADGPVRTLVAAPGAPSLAVVTTA